MELHLANEYQCCFPFDLLVICCAVLLWVIYRIANLSLFFSNPVMESQSSNDVVEDVAHAQKAVSVIFYEWWKVMPLGTLMSAPVNTL